MQTAVDFIEEKLDIILELYASEWDKINEVLKQAKEMEREQRESDFVDGYKERAEISNLIFDEASETLAKSIFSNKLQNQ